MYLKILVCQFIDGGFYGLVYKHTIFHKTMAFSDGNTDISWTVRNTEPLQLYVNL